MLTRNIKDKGVWIESTEGFKVLADLGNGNSSGITYVEADRVINLDAVLWHDLAKDQKADVNKMSAKQLSEFCERMVTLVHVPDILHWWKTKEHPSVDDPVMPVWKTGELVSEEDRSRILGNIRAALEFEKLKPRFVRQ